MTTAVSDTFTSSPGYRADRLATDLRYGDLSLRYQDTIVGHLYGHMNIDHFFFFDVDDLEATHKDLKSKSTLNFPDTLSNLSIDAVTGQPLRHGNVLPSSSRMQIMGRSGNAGLVDTLKKDFDDMPGPKKIKMEDYAVINVGASVIPTYLPGLRIYT
jgi:endopolyphosphatase